MTAATVAVRERPLLMTGEMVRATLDGRKTKTRRVAMHTVCGVRLARLACDPAPDPARCPYGQPGDRLWVRETWAAEFYWPMLGGGERRQWSAMPAANRLPSREAFIAFRATRTVHGCDDLSVDPVPCAEVHHDGWKWRPSIFMPRWASRITLELTDVRVERLQDISESDAIAEGCADTDRDCPEMDGELGGGFRIAGWHEWVSALGNFALLWDSLNEKRGYGWDVNPWVWALSFRRVES